MNILAAIKREEKKLEKEMGKLQHQLNGIRSAAKALGHTAAVEVKGAKRRVMSSGTKSRDLEGGEEAMGETEETGDESCELKACRVAEVKTLDLIVGRALLEKSTIRKIHT
jgi:hypothetical protein